MDRGLDDSMTLDEINKIKKPEITAIPTGRYEIVITKSPRFKRLLPLLLNVKGYAGIRIHPGNVAPDTEGCLLPGTTKGTNVVSNSKNAFDALFKLLQATLKKEQVFISIKHFNAQE